MRSVDDFFASAPLPWLRARTIFLTRHGSHAYGLNTPSSDEDFKGVAIPPREYFAGFVKTFEQSEANDPDLVIYEIRKFFRLARDCNPNIIEVLWTDASDHILVHPVAEQLVNARGLFLSKKARYTFSGYAIAQLKRINTHHGWLRNPPTHAPRREDYGLLAFERFTGDQRDQIGAALALVQQEVGTWEELTWTELDDAARIALKGKISEFLSRAKVSKEDVFVNAGKQLGLDDNFIAMLLQEKTFRGKKQEWANYQGWLVNRNKARSELEAKFGYDTKHAMHLVRLLRMCREILETGKVQVKRPDRDELLAIRNGDWSYERLIEWAKEQDSAMDALYAKSKLPAMPDDAQLDALCTRMVDALSA
jgi:uncharacterized protein